MHKAVRHAYNEATPPVLSAKRLNEDSVEITYTSERKLCHLAKGLTEGVVHHYGSAHTVRMLKCMSHGDDKTVLLVAP